jgi:DNA-binding transcriptional MerR regulator
MQHAHISSPKRLFSIGEMCDAYGVTARALRFYEDEGLIAPERRGTQRLYSERDRARVAWVLRGKRTGFSLAEIRELLDLYDLGDQRRTQKLVALEKCREKIATLERQRSDIDATITELKQFIDLVRNQI